jgi:hypothetical protein
MEKFNSLIHYICEKCKDPTKLGAIKLNKILYFSDFIFYKLTGKPITESIYMKRQFGPVPEQILPALEELESQNKIRVRDTIYYDKPKKEYISLTDPDIKRFSSEEISLVDKVIDIIVNGHTASSISELSHNRIWEIADIGEEIPLYTAFASDYAEINEKDMEWAKKSLIEVG